MPWKHRGMPIYCYKCALCAVEIDGLVRATERLAPPMPCAACGGPLQYAGLSSPSIGTEQRFGAILNDGTRVKGGLGHVKRRPRTL